VVTDQTSSHDPANGYLPKGWTVAEWERRRDSSAKEVALEARQSIAEHVRAMLGFHRMGIPTVDYGNNIRQVARDEGVEDAFDFSGFCPGLHPAAVLPWRRPVPLGRAVRRPRGYLSHGRRREGSDAGRCASAQLAGYGALTDSLSGPAGADLLGGPGGPHRVRRGCRFTMAAASAWAILSTPVW
jgi:hypothetical protein